MEILPVYEYLCEECDRKIEINHKMKDESKKYCSKCGNELEKIISKSSFRLNWLYEEPKR